MKIFIAFFTALLIGVAANGQAAERESVYDRVMRTHTLRCGYTSWPPFIEKDANSGRLSGVFVDYMAALGQALHVKIDWTMEVGWGDFIEALETDKIDAWCTGGWPNSERAARVDFVRPISYQAVMAFVRPNDDRFDNNIERANRKDIVISVVDGATNALVANTDFPLAQKKSLPQLTEMSNVLLDVATGKADMTFLDMTHGADFMARNPGRIRPVKLDRPLRSFGNVIAIKADQYRFKAMLGTTTDELISSGQIEKFLQKYEKYPGNIYRVNPPYQLPVVSSSGAKQ